MFRQITLKQPIKLRHRTRLDGIHDVDVGFHGLVARLYQFSFFIPGRFLVDLATSLKVQPLEVERGAEPDLEKVVVFPVSPFLCLFGITSFSYLCNCSHKPHTLSNELITDGDRLTFTAEANSGSARSGIVVFETPEGCECSIVISQAASAD